jgi:hypothetical protein
MCTLASFATMIRHGESAASLHGESTASLLLLVLQTLAEQATSLDYTRSLTVKCKRYLLLFYDCWPSTLEI